MLMFFNIELNLKFDSRNINKYTILFGPFLLLNIDR